MKTQIKVETISIKVGDVTLQLSPEDAKKLRDELNSIFPVAQFNPPIVIDRTPTEPTYPQPWWKNPVYGSDTILPKPGNYMTKITSTSSLKP